MKWKQAKSTVLCLRFCCELFKRFKAFCGPYVLGTDNSRSRNGRNSLVKIICTSRLPARAIFVWTCFTSLSVLIGLAILLLRAGIESNPGPVTPLTEFPPFTTITQNCRGLTEYRKACKFIKCLNRSIVSQTSTIACLQETHCTNRFALDNLFKGTYVTDDGERNQRGVAILIPEVFQLCQSRVSGLGRWAIVSLKVANSQAQYRLVVATIYAPNCHREAKVMFQDFSITLICS